MVAKTRLRILATMAVAVACTLPQTGAVAQQSQDWFVPGQPHPAATPRPTPAPGPRAAPPRTLAPVQVLPPPPDNQPPAADNQPMPQLPSPPVPELPALAKGTPPPNAIIGVLGVPEVMRASTAAQAVEKVIGERREKLNQDAQKEQAAWRELQQALAAQRNNLSGDQIRNREHELQDRITNAQRSFRDRNRIIQEAAQVALGQIERELIAVIRQVAESRGMNLVLHRAQVALNINEFDITEQVTAQLNQILPSVVIPPDGQVPTAANTQLPATVATNPAVASSTASPPAATTAASLPSSATAPAANPAASTSIKKK